MITLSTMLNILAIIIFMYVLYIIFKQFFSRSNLKKEIKNGCD